jgi:hypothetical protein
MTTATPRSTGSAQRSRAAPGDATSSAATAARQFRRCSTADRTRVLRLVQARCGRVASETATNAVRSRSRTTSWATRTATRSARCRRRPSADDGPGAVRAYVRRGFDGYPTWSSKRSRTSTTARSTCGRWPTSRGSTAASRSSATRRSDSCPASAPPTRSSAPRSSRRARRRRRGDRAAGALAVGAANAQEGRGEPGGVAAARENHVRQKAHGRERARSDAASLPGREGRAGRPALQHDAVLRKPRTHLNPAARPTPESPWSG